MGVKVGRRVYVCVGQCTAGVWGMFSHHIMASFHHAQPRYILFLVSILESEGQTTLRVNLRMNIWISLKQEGKKFL